MRTLSILAMTCLLLVACDRRDLTYDYYPYCDVTIETDWSLLGENPTGMTVIFYPTDGSQVITHTTNSIHRTKISLREGCYNILLFNQSPGEFGTIDFRGLEQYETAEVFARSIDPSKSWYTPEEGEVLASHPESFGVAVVEGFEVTEQMIGRQAASLPVEESILRLIPRNIMAEGMVTVHIKGIDRLRAIRGSISGMAGGFHLGAYVYAESSVTHLLENWQKKINEDNPVNGTIVTSYDTFGMPGLKLSRANAGTRAVIENTFQDAILRLQLLLVDNQTVMKFAYQVKDHIKVEEETGRITLTLEIFEAIPDLSNPDGPLIPVPPGGGDGGETPPGGGDGGETPPGGGDGGETPPGGGDGGETPPGGGDGGETPPGGGDGGETPPGGGGVVLPDVKPENGSSSGFDATVNNWGDEEKIEAEVK